MDPLSTGKNNWSSCYLMFCDYLGAELHRYAVDPLREDWKIQVIE
jgi:hypothetical protein